MAKEFKAHMMYKGKEAENAETYEEHLKLKKKGYGHSKSGFKMRTPFRCWKTHERVPGTVKGAKGSCQHKNPAKRPK